ncbi:MAG: DUF3536 domain-containing protein [Candidatus Binataceae bacterium]|nr:DUF3536 domain-containing protein [Candidatus Binataceae bacterium]
MSNEPRYLEPRYLIIHGHFYQPPRESPWTGLINQEHGAAPYANWNEKILAECYEANAAAQVAEGNLIQLHNNYERINFDCGPTLARWLARHGRNAYRAMLRGDQVAAGRHDGHGNAIAQASNHSILPLLSPRDREIQIAWGLEDFRFRFGREAEGLWLPECAVDEATLETVASAGVKFVIAGSDQGRFGAADANDRSAGPFLWRGTAGTVAIFRFDRRFSSLLCDNHGPAETPFADQIAEALFAMAPGEALVLAADGEYFGHHKRNGADNLARLLTMIDRREDIAITNCSAYLANHPARGEFTVSAPSSWSCPHGIERWRSDCGCRLEAKTSQEWRAPLRTAIEFARDHSAALYERFAGQIVSDPWAALKASIELSFDPADLAAAARFFDRYKVSEEGKQQLLMTLFEMEQAAHTALTSCAWFFDDFGGPEGRIALRWAARTVELAALFAPTIEPELLDRLRAIKSNRREVGEAASLYLSLKTRESRGRI